MSARYRPRPPTMAAHRPDPNLTVTINGERHEVPTGTSVAELLERLRVDPRHSAVERNRTIVPRSAFATTPLVAGDELEIVTLVGGG